MEIIPSNENFISDRTKSGRGRYSLDGRPLTGVTTICNEQAKRYLIDWAAKESYKDALELSKEEIKDVLKNKNYAHRRKSDKAKDKGTEAHDMVELFVNTYIETGKYVVPEIEDKEVRTSVSRFCDWAIENNVEFLGSEVSVYSREHWYAGSFDFVCKLNGKLLLGDFKTSKHMDNTYFAQGAGYIIAVEENNPEMKFDGIIIVRSILAEEADVWYEKSSNGKYKKMQSQPFEVSISTNVEREKAYFLSLLNLYRYNKGYEIKRWYSAEVVDFLPDDYPEYE